MTDQNNEKEPLLDSDSNYHGSFTEKCCSTRYKVGFLGSLGTAALCSMRVTMSIAIVSMVEQQPELDLGSYNQDCPKPTIVVMANHSRHEKFDWTRVQQTYVLTAPFYGYLISQIPGAYLSSIIGGKVVFGYGTLIRAILFILNPPIAFLGVQWLILSRVLEGVMVGLTQPALNHVVARWAPKLERSYFSGFSYAGASFGPVVAYPFVGYLCSLEFFGFGGWVLSFIIIGSISIFWSLLWIFTVYECPEDDPTITESERLYITKSTEIHNSNKHAIPWRKIATSVPVYGFVISFTTQDIINYVISSTLPTYLANVLNLKVSNDGLLSSLPWICCFFGTVVASSGTDHLRQKNLVSTTLVRKLNEVISAILPSVCLVLAGYAGCDASLVVSLISIAMFFFGFHFVGSTCNNLDIAPYFAGTVYAIANTFGTVSGILMPLVMEAITKDDVHSKQLWLYCFYAIGASSTFGVLCYLVMGSGEAQSWGNPQEEDVDTEP
ncbi:sialin-like [Convolutriloba macropyga]|uniref:sialin-like n=1 Tax=Convolutriloba macropyga TaxID=536237 RepID=UPI003F521C21